MKVLVVSGTPWNDNNSFGNTYTNLFRDFGDLQFANIYCKAGDLNNPFDMDGFQITEKSILKNLIHRNRPSGRKVHGSNSETANDNLAHYQQAQKLRWRIFFVIRDMIWSIGKWRSKELADFIREFQPDIIFQPIYRAAYLNKVIHHVHSIARVPVIGYVSDDVYLVKGFSLSPFYWINREIDRKHIRKVLKNCSLLYTVSEIQKQEYEDLFQIECKILTKAADFSAPAPIKETYGSPCIFLYTGNLGANRWKSLAMLAQAIEKLNRTGPCAKLLIYTATPITAKMEQALNIAGSSEIMGFAEGGQMAQLQQNADFLVHVESLDRKNKAKVRHSFSTKLVDYFAAARPVLAIGPKDIASIDHLIRNDCAIVADSEEELTEKLQAVLGNKEALDRLAKQAYHCGRTHHNKEITQQMLMRDINRIGTK